MDEDTIQRQIQSTAHKLIASLNQKKSSEIPTQKLLFDNRQKVKLLNRKLPEKLQRPILPPKCGPRPLAKLKSSFCDPVTLPLQPLPHVPPPPPTFAWEPIRKNIFVDDEYILQNIPYIGDGEDVLEVINSYDGKVHNQTDLETLDESDLRLIVNKLHHIFQATSNCHNLVHSSLRDSFSAILTPEEFNQRYQLLWSRGHLTADIDREMGHVLSSDVEMHSFRALFCRRCYKYDCPHHNDEAPSRRRPQMGGKFECSRNCSGALVYRIPARKYCPGWSAREKTLVGILADVFGDDCCSITRLLGTKKCADICKYLHTLSKVSEPTPQNFAPMPRRKKRKKISKSSQSRFYFPMCKSSSRHKQEASIYIPCCHKGKSCEEVVCSCITRSKYCEKFCDCDKTCSYRFQGCRCERECQTKSCPCFAALRECDPDLCKSCGAADVDWEKTTCRNVNMQRCLKKKLFIGRSVVSGLGVFMGESVERDTFLSEYCGELITQDEADRRGPIYDRLKSSFLFNLNKEYVVDATRKGNEIRFANHSVRPNCYAKILFVNGDYRIGIFSKRQISHGEEIFFDYSYGNCDHLAAISLERAC